MRCTKASGTNDLEGVEGIIILSFVLASTFAGVSDTLDGMPPDLMANATDFLI